MSTRCDDSVRERCWSTPQSPIPLLPGLTAGGTSVVGWAPQYPKIGRHQEACPVTRDAVCHLSCQWASSGWLGGNANNTHYGCMGAHLTSAGRSHPADFQDGGLLQHSKGDVRGRWDRDKHLSDLDLRQTLAHSLIGQDKAYLPHMLPTRQIRDDVRCLWHPWIMASALLCYRQARYQPHRGVQPRSKLFAVRDDLTSVLGQNR